VTEPRCALCELTLARLRLFFREPSAVFWAFGFPMILTVALGIAFRNRPPDPVHVAIVSGQGAQRTLTDIASPSVNARIVDAATAEAELRSGKVAILVGGGDPRVYRYDETRPEARLARAIVDDVLQRASGRADVVRVADDRIIEPGTRYVDFLIPGLVGLNLMSSSMWGIGYSIVEMRTKKLVKRLLATPMRRSDFLLSFMVMRAVFVAVEVPVLFGFGWIAFGVRISGSPVLLLGLCFLGALTFGGLGLLVGSRAQNTQTVGGLMNLVMMPMFIASGVFFSTAKFPEAMQPILRVLPLTALNDSLRAVANEGAALGGVLRPTVVLATWALLSYAAALRIFRWS